MPNMKPNNLDVYFRFLLEVLPGIVDKGGEAQVVYPLLAANIDKLDLNLAKALRYWAASEFTDVQSNKAQDIAGDILCFSTLIQQFPLGDRASNIEIAIAGYEMALMVFTRDEFPEDWTLVQSNMGTAYRDRIAGDRADNIEKAIAIHNAVSEARTPGSEEWAGTQMNLGAAYLSRILGSTADNIEEAIAAFNAAIEVFTRNEFPQEWVMIQNNLGVAYRNRIIGVKADNIEKAIIACTDALKVCTRSEVHKQWAAMAQTTLGNAYYERIRGEKADNIEKAISAYTGALEFYTRVQFPEQWALIQNNLGGVYRDRIHGEKADNIEKAISACKAALEIRTCNALPQAWAETQTNLGSAYHERIRGEKADNIEKAISAYKAALEIYTCQNFPQQWAMVQTNLGNVYRDRIFGDKADNIEKAIAACTATSEVLTHEEFPQLWATMQVDMGNAYNERIFGDEAKNFEKALIAYKAALKVYTREHFPQQWAMVQTNLGSAYWRNRIHGDETENIEKAIAAYTATLEVLTHDKFPQLWAMMQTNLGIAYSDRIIGDKAENIEKAIAAFTNALKVFTRNSFPQEWALVQNNMGVAYSSRGEQRDKAENMVLAFQAYSNALEVRTRDAFPTNHVETKFNLGILYQDAQRFADAYTIFKSAIETVELLREEIVDSDEVKRKQAEKWNQLYRCMIKVCLAQDNVTEAIEYAERSKTRNLVELILNRDFKTIFPTEVVNQLEQLRDKIAAGQDKLQNGIAENPKALAQYLQNLRQQRNELQNKYLPVGYGFNLQQFQANLDEETAIIMWFLIGATWEVFIITRSNLQRFNTSLQDNSLNTLVGYSQEYFTTYYENRAAWINSLPTRFTHLSQILKLEKVINLLPDNCSCLVLIPHLLLHLFPIHTLPLSNGKLLYERFPNGVNYAPSCQILQQMQERKRTNLQSIFAIQNPTEDLNASNWEIENILSFFSSQQVLSNSQATKYALDQVTSNLKNVNYLHFACHGYFNLDSPINSFLLLADAYVSSDSDADSEKYFKTPGGRIIDLSKCLTLGNLFEQSFNLSQCRLVILSACETGLIDFQNMSDEYIGLPSGFLYAGSSCVVSSLWTVDDLSTAYLMTKLLQNLQDAFALGQDVSIAVALNQAQTWLRNITREDLQKWKSSLHSLPPLDIAEERDREIKPKRPQPENLKNEKPFESPYYWAAFTAIGK